MRRLQRAIAVGALLSGCTASLDRPLHEHPSPAATAVAVDDGASAFRDTVAVAAERLAATSERTPTTAWERLSDLVDSYGSRITGSAALEHALAWAAARMRDDDLDDVRLEPAMVPHWVRGQERARIVRPVVRPMALLGLGGTVGTRRTVRAKLVAFDDLDALRAAGPTLDGTITLVNHRMLAYDEEHDDPGYLQGMQARLHAASEAGRRGALAVLIRSVTATSLRTPHTGALEYTEGAPKIPAAAISIEDAELLARLARRGGVEVELFLGARTLSDTASANAVGELRGRERPEEIVLLGAHLDSWDVGAGASDDAAGCIAVMEALRLLRTAGLVPRRTIRAVLFTGEEYGLAGAKAYHQRHGGEPHVAAFETDYGMGTPDAIGIAGEEQVEAMAPLLPLFGRFGIRRFRPRAFGSDVAPIVKDGALALSLLPDGHHYFDIHHTEADTLDKIHPDDLRRNAAAIALLGYVLAER